MVTAVVDSGHEWTVTCSSHVQLLDGCFSSSLCSSHVRLYHQCMLQSLRHVHAFLPALFFRISRFPLPVLALCLGAMGGADTLMIMADGDWEACSSQVEIPPTRSEIPVSSTSFAK